MTKLSGAQIIVETLKAEGITHVFGVSGSVNLPILDIIFSEPQIRYIQTQHEQNAMYMANGYARATRTAGICLVSPGPGITNCLSGTAQAFQSSTPNLLIGVEEGNKVHGLGSSCHHDVEAVMIFKPVTKLSLRVEHVGRLLGSLQMAFRTALTGRKGPVYVGIAKDILMDEADVEILSPLKYRVEHVPTADPLSVSKAADLLIGAKSPVILAGGGVAWAQAQDILLDLAGFLAIPVATSRDNKGVIPDDHPLALGTVGHSSTPLAVKTIQDTDILLAIGCTFDSFTTMGLSHKIVPKHAKIIQVDIDPTEIGKIYPVEVGICGDARPVLNSILQRIRKKKVARVPLEQVPRIKELVRRKRNWQKSLMAQKTSGKIPIQRFRLLHDLRQALPRDAIVAGESGGTHGWYDYGFEALAHNYGIGSWHPMGAEYLEALGVKVALPDRVVVCFTGDGSMMMTLQEIATAVAYHIPLLCVVCHNGVFGNMRYTQIQQFGGRFIGTDLLIPNLANIAKEFGAYGERVEKPDEIIPAISRALASGKPALLDIMIDASPENLVPPPLYHYEVA